MNVSCNNCGNMCTEGTQFCPKCGTATFFYYAQEGEAGGDVNGVPTLPGVAKQKVFTDYGTLPVDLMEKSIYEPINPYRIVPPPPPPRPRGKMKFIVGGLVVFLVIPLLLLSGFGAYALITQRPKASSTNLVGGISATASVKSVATTASFIPSAEATAARATPISGIATPIVGVVTPAATSIGPQGCGGAFSDDFMNTLHAGWVWVDPAGHGTYKSGSGALAITATGNSDLNATTNNDAPRLLQPIQGNFTVETQVVMPGNLPVGFLAAGLLLWQDDTNFLRLERASATFDYEQEVNGVFSHDAPQSLAAATIPAMQVGLQLKRVGDVFTAAWRLPGQSWQVISAANVHFQNVRVGLFVVNESVSQVSVAYSQFKVVCG